MYLSRLTLNSSRMSILWRANAYRVHQRIRMACGNDPHLLFRIEESTQGIAQILVQSQTEPNWKKGFDDFPVLLRQPEYKSLSPTIGAECHYRFRLLANPTMKKTIVSNGEARKVRLGILDEGEQQKWIQRKIGEAGGKLIAIRITPLGFQHSRKNPVKEINQQTHIAVLFEGVLQVRDPLLLHAAMEHGIGSAKGYGFGLLSLALVSG
jgi:CRISPR system Cascade subunit CasE